MIAFNEHTDDMLKSSSADSDNGYLDLNRFQLFMVLKTADRIYSRTK